MTTDVFRKMTLDDKADRESASHRRLRRRLDGWADSLGFSQREQECLRGIKPDVVRVDPSGKWLFVGDAAMADHEQPDAPGVKDRVAACAAELAFLIKTQQIDGGRFAIATDSEKIAGKWAKMMTGLMRRQGLLDETGKPPAFTVKRLSPKTWVAYW